MFNPVFISASSACFELENELVYYAKKEYTVFVNGVAHEEVFSTNVFSLFGLTPDAEYSVTTSIDDFCLKFKTESETVCLSVTDFGAKGDGVSDDTAAIQTAINAVAEGGRVYVPKGIYYIRPIILKSNMTLELEKDAVLLGSVKEADYPVWPGELSDMVTGEKYQCATWEGCPASCHQPFISAHRAKNVSIIGRGEIDGNAQNSGWWINPKERKIGRPRLFFINDCDNVTLHGITVRNSPSWTIHPFFSRDFSLLDARVNAPKDSPNTDGCDPESCDGVKIIGTVFSVGDDCIAIKSGKIYMGAKYRRPADRHVIRNCLMRYGHGAVVLGSEISGGVKNLTVNRCFFEKTDRGLRIKTRRGRGKDAIVDNVLFEKIEMKEVLTPLVINMYYFCDPDGKSDAVQSREPRAVDETTPFLGSFEFRDIVCRDSECAAGFFFGLPEMPIKSIKLKNISFGFKKNAEKSFPAMMCGIEELSKKGLCFHNVERVELEKVAFDGIEGEEVTAENVGSVLRR